MTLTHDHASPRVALFHPTLAFGGAERVMLNLARGLLDAGVAVDYVVANGQGEFRDQVPQRARLFDLASRRLLGSLPRLVRYLRQEWPAAMLSAADHANVAALWAQKLARVPARMVISQHTAFSQNLRFAFGWRGRLAVRLARRAYPSADAFVAVSAGVADDLAQELGIARSAIAVIHNPIVTPELLAQSRKPVDHPWFRSSGPPVIVSAGRLYPQKDYPTLLRAFAVLRQQVSARLMILGDGPERPALERLAAELRIAPDLAFPGYVTNPAAYFRHAALFALSSAWEGFPIVLVEAMVAGTPIVSTDCSAGPREVLADGKYGRVVPVGDHVRLAQAIRHALAEGRKPYPPEALSRFEIGGITAQYLDVLFAGMPHRSSTAGA